MVAYNFNPRFEVAIREGWKTQTIRRGRKVRNVRPGELLQLFIGQRTPDCRLICAPVRCTEVMPIQIHFAQDGGIDRIVTDGVPVLNLDDFATRDGFTDSDDIAAFWRETYEPMEVFHGLVIEWAMPRSGVERVAA